MVLADDPSFLPDLNITQLPDGIDFDMDEAGALLNLEEDFGISSISFDRDSSVQNSARMSSRVGSILGTPQLDLMIATSDTAAGDYEFIPGPGLEDEDDRFLEDVGFEFDADGQMRELPMPPSEIDSMAGGKIASIGPSRRGRAGSVQSIGRGSRMGSEEAAAQVLREHEDGRGGRGFGVVYSFRVHLLDPDTDSTSSTTTTTCMHLQKTMDSTSLTVLKGFQTAYGGCRRRQGLEGLLRETKQRPKPKTYLSRGDVVLVPQNSLSMKKPNSGMPT